MLLRSIFSAVGRNYVVFENEFKAIPSRRDKLSF